MSAHYTPTTWVSGTTPASAANMNNIEGGIVAVDNAKADLAGATFTGAVAAPSLTANAQGITVSGANQGVELGAKASANTPFVDFNSSGNSNDYDVRMIASGGTASSGNGTLNIAAASLTRNGQTVWDNANDGPGSGLYADNSDKLNGLAASAYAQLAALANFTAGLQTGGKGVVFAQAGLTGKFSAQSTAPTSPADGDLWLDTSTVLS